MSRIFFDAMMFVYLLEDNPQFASDVKQTLERCYQRDDTLMTSCLAVGEVMAAGTRVRGTADIARSTIREMGFSLVPFDESCSAARTDMFLTNDTQLLQRRLHVPGIQFIADFTKPIL